MAKKPKKTKKPKITKDMAIGHIVKHFCYEEVPDEWDTMTVEDQETWLAEHVWDQFEGMEGADIYAEIESMADSMLSFLKLNGIAVDFTLNGGRP